MSKSIIISIAIIFTIIASVGMANAEINVKTNFNSKSFIATDQNGKQLAGAIATEPGFNQTQVPVVVTSTSPVSNNTNQTVTPTPVNETQQFVVIPIPAKNDTTTAVITANQTVVATTNNISKTNNTGVTVITEVSNDNNTVITQKPIKTNDNVTVIVNSSSTVPITPVPNPMANATSVNATVPVNPVSIVVNNSTVLNTPNAPVPQANNCPISGFIVQPDGTSKKFTLCYDAVPAHHFHHFTHHTHPAAVK